MARAVAASQQTQRDEEALMVALAVSAAEVAAVDAADLDSRHDVGVASSRGAAAADEVDPTVGPGIADDAAASGVPSVAPEAETVAAPQAGPPGTPWDARGDPGAAPHAAGEAPAVYSLCLDDGVSSAAPNPEDAAGFVDALDLWWDAADQAHAGDASAVVSVGGAPDSDDDWEILEDPF